MGERFTIDGGQVLEDQLARACEQVLEGVRSVVPANRLEALVLGGGYGRGQGGVLRTGCGEQPYNDLEFYAFLRGNRLWCERRFSLPLARVAEELSARLNSAYAQAGGLHVEFKIENLSRFRREPVSMFSYDLVAGHRLIHGASPTFAGCEHHLDPTRIPFSEATRLLFNRCSGLLIAADFLSLPQLDLEQADFVARNTAKACLAVGDAVLTVSGEYHWDCLKRHSKLLRVARELGDEENAALAFSIEEVCRMHAAGVEFKLHPTRCVRVTDEVERRHREVLSLSQRIWLWIESKRLNCRFDTVDEYARYPEPKCPETNAGRNLLLNLRTFGPGAALDGMACRYPRERLFNSLPLLLWNGMAGIASVAIPHLQKQLRTSASDWRGLVAAYKALWPAYG